MKKTQLMGILNCTPDSFYDGGRYFDPETAILQGARLIEEGTHILDIGGESSRPGSESISVEEEQARILPVVAALSPRIPLSIDTTKQEVAEAALKLGASILNDITGFSSSAMRALARESRARLIVMHMQGSPKTMQVAPSYPRGVVQELMEWFKERIDLLVSEGIDPSQIVIDPGIGFGKSVEDNLKIIRNIPTLKMLGFPLLIGLSRKSFQSKILQKPPSALLSTTVALNTMCLLLGADIIRVHDVQEHRDVLAILERFPDGYATLDHSLS